ncbi:serine/threonine protein kinase [Pedobacter sp. NJ-S-72]
MVIKVTVKHGDIKSNNVKFNVHTGNYVLLDFGLSAMSDEQRRTSIRHAGAIEFMAPEQSEGQMLFETDIYSYGVILYELLAGQVPFPLLDNGQKSRNDVLVGHLELPVPDLLTLRKEHMPESWSDDKVSHEMQVPGWLMTVIGKCLEKAPASRYRNGMELQYAIVHSSIADSGNKYSS